MTTASLHTRLRKVERSQGLDGELEQMTDTTLERAIRSGYRAMTREHGSLDAAIRVLEASDELDDHALAVLIREDIAEGRADTWLKGRAQ